MKVKTFYVGIKGIIISKGKALVLKSSDGDRENNDEWDIPGGRIDDDETIAETLNRELREELPSIKGFTVENLVYVHRLDHDLKDGKGLFLAFFKVSAEEFEVKLSDEHTEYKWVSKDDIDELSMADGYKEAVKIALK